MAMDANDDKLGMLAAAAAAAPEDSGMRTPTRSATTALAPAAPPRSKVKVVVQDQSGNVVEFSVKPSTKMAKIMKAYCQHMNTDVDALRWLWDGVRFCPESTVQQLGIDDGDVIHCFIEQVGGGGGGVAPKEDI